MRVTSRNRTNSVLRDCGKWAVCVVVALTLAAHARAVQNGVIKGRVAAETPDQRKPLAGVVVRLSGPQADKQIQTVSDEEGGYDFAGLVAGDYVVTVELQGFQKFEQKVGVQIEATV